MFKLIAALGVAAATFAVADHALALNPQPLPPFQSPVVMRHTQGHAAHVLVRRRHGSSEVISVRHSIVSPRDAASGLPTGKRMHKPFEASGLPTGKRIH